MTEQDARQPRDEKTEGTDTVDTANLDTANRDTADRDTATLRTADPDGRGTTTPEAVTSGTATTAAGPVGSAQPDPALAGAPPATPVGIGVVGFAPSGSSVPAYTGGADVDGGRRRGPDPLALFVGLATLAMAVFAFVGELPDLSGFDPRWLLAAGAALVGLVLLVGSLRGRSRGRRSG